MAIRRDAVIYIKGKTDADAMLGRVSGAAAQTTSTVARLGTVLKTLGGYLAAGAIIQGLRSFATNMINTADALDALSQRTGASVEFLSAMSHVMEQNKTSIGAFNTAFRGLSRMLYDAQSGLAESKRAFADIGIELEDIEGQNPERVFLMVVDAISKIPDPLRKAALAQKIFGRSGMELLPVINQGTEAIRAQMEEAYRLGAVISTEFAKDAAKFKDNMDAITRAVKGLGYALSGDTLSDLATLTGLVRSLANSADKFGAFGDALAKISSMPEAKIIKQLIEYSQIVMRAVKTYGGSALYEGAVWLGERQQRGAGLLAAEVAAQRPTAPTPRLPETITPTGGKTAAAKQKEIYQGAMGLAQEGYRFQSHLNDITYEDLFAKQETFSERRISDVMRWSAVTQDTQGLIYENQKAIRELEQEEERQRMAAFARYATQMLTIPASTFGNMLSQAIVDGKQDFNEMWKAALRGAIALTAQMITMLVIAKIIKVTLGSIGGPFGTFFSVVAEMMSMNTGGRVPHAQSGMYVPGTAPTPIIAHGGEYVNTASAVDAIGAANFAYMNAYHELPNQGGSKGDTYVENHHEWSVYPMDGRGMVDAINGPVRDINELIQENEA